MRASICAVVAAIGLAAHPAFAQANRTAILGCEGKWAIHPSQIAIANDVFAPTPEEVRAANEAVGAYRSAESEGVGAIGRDGKLVDAAHMRHAANILDKAALISGSERQELR